MTTPDQVIPPRLPNETPYQYRVRRTLARYGQTPYQRRIFLGQQRGLGSRAAAGHRTPPGVTEYQVRRQQYIESTGVIPSVLTQAYARNWLISNGFTPETTGASWTYLYQMEPSLRNLANRTSPEARMQPDDIRMAVQLEKDEVAPARWTIDRLRGRLFDTVEYQDQRDKDPGNYDYNVVRLYAPSDDLDIKWWYYHLWQGNGSTMGETRTTSDSEQWMVRVAISPTNTHSLARSTSIYFYAPMNSSLATEVLSRIAVALISWRLSQGTESGQDSFSITT